MSTSKEGSTTGSHSQQQDVHSLQHRKAFGGSDQKQLQPLHDSDEEADYTVNLSYTDQTQSAAPNSPAHVDEQSRTTSAINHSHPTTANPSRSVTPEKFYTESPINPSSTESTTLPPRKSHVDNLTISDLALLAITLSPALLHLWARCFAPTSTFRLFGTWFALLTLPISAPLYRWEKVPGLVRDVLEIMSYGSALTITVDTAIVTYRYLTEYPPTKEWEWLIYYPGFLAAGVSWLVIIGFMWGLVVVEGY